MGAFEGEGNPYGGIIAIAVSFVCTVIAISISSWHIAMHLKNYTEPTYQRYIVRIIFMVPVYATMSFGALAYGQYAMYFNTIRDVYEAWVIYNFMSLCLAWVGGPGAVVTSLSGRMLKPSCLLMTCFFPPIPLDGRFIRRCKQGCLQFVFLKPLLAATCLVLYSRGLYHDGDFSLTDSYVYITVVYMASYTVAIYALILFYVACKDLLHSFNPIPKFLMIKAVVFLTYWQGVVIFTVGEIGLVKGGAEDAADLQNVLICVEMALGALGFLYAFPYAPFMHANVTGARGGTGGAPAEGLSDSIKHAIDMHDVVSDTVHQFAPTYHDYVLYSNGSEDLPSHYRTRTFVPKGLDTSAFLQSASSKDAGAEMTTALSMESTEPSEADDLSSRANSLVTDPLVPPAQQQQQLLRGAGQGSVRHEPLAAVPEGSPGTPPLAGMAATTTSLSVGGSSLVVRLPPPPPPRSSSSGVDDSGGGSGTSSQRSSATGAGETTTLTKHTSPQLSSASHGLDLLVDEEDLKKDPAREDLEGFILR